MDFRVDFPQLESPPRQSNYGRKFFSETKNLTSADFLLGDDRTVPKMSPRPAKPKFSYPPQPYSPRILEKYKQLSDLRGRAGSMDRRNDILRKIREPPRRPTSLIEHISSMPPLVHRRVEPVLFEKKVEPPKFKDHPVFAVPKFTKAQPKVIYTSPITGIINDPFQRIPANTRRVNSPII